MDAKIKIDQMVSAIQEMKKDPYDTFTVKLGEMASGTVYSTEETLRRVIQDRCYRGPRRRKTDRREKDT